MTHYHNLLLLLLFLLLTTALRFHGQLEMAMWLHHDEAYYAIDAISLLENPQFQVYFPANSGREGLWINLLALMFSGVGISPFTMRMTSALVGIATVAAVYWLGREVLEEGAVWVSGALAVVYWHMHLSHIGFRVIMFPLIAALSMATLLNAHRLNRRWMLAGALLGLTLYTYTAAQIYVVYGIACLLFFFISEPKQRRGVLIASVSMGVVISPLLIAFIFQAEATDRVQSLFISDVSIFFDNMRNWANAWLAQGDPFGTHNLENRPILDIPLAILAGCGVIGLWVKVREKIFLLWWLGLVASAFIPTLLAMQTPHFLRGSGLLIPLALLIGAGGAWMSQWRYTKLFPLILILWAGYNSYTDFSLWLAKPNRLVLYSENRVNEGMVVIHEATQADMPIIMLGTQFDPNAMFWGGSYGRDVYFFNSSDNACYVSPRTPYAVLDLNNDAGGLNPYLDDIQSIYNHPENNYTIFTVTPSNDLTNDWDNAPQFGDFLSAQVMSSTENSISAGDTLQIYWAMRLETALNRQDYRVLVHLQGEPTPYDGGSLYSTGDVPLCDFAYTEQALAENMTIIQSIALIIPDDLPAGNYHLAMGFYEPDNFARLPVSPAENIYDYINAWEFNVRE